MKNETKISTQQSNQPQITTDIPTQAEQPLDQDTEKQLKTQSNKNEQTKQNPQNSIEMIRKRHPDCIPVFYVKHQASPKDFPSPQTPLQCILFNKQLKIDQAMYTLYNQIKIKGLYFFCLRYNTSQKKIKHVLLKPGQTIQQIYNKFGKEGYLTLIYGDRNIGMGGINKMEKMAHTFSYCFGISLGNLIHIPLYCTDAVLNTFQWYRNYNNSTSPSSSKIDFSHPKDEPIIIEDQIEQNVDSTLLQPNEDIWAQTIVHTNQTQL